MSLALLTKCAKVGKYNKTKRRTLKKEKVLQILRFLISGGVSLITYYLTLYTLTDAVSVWYVASSIIAGILSFGINFALQKFWTFKNKDLRAIPKQLIWYSVMKLGMIGGNAALLYCLVDYLHLHYLVASVILTIVFSIVSYFITHTIFKK